MAKKANKPFLIILSLIVVLGGIGAFGGYKLLRSWKQPKPDQLIAQGEEAMKDQRYDQAAARFAQAAIFMPNDPKPLTLTGNALFQLSKSDPEYLPRAVGQWDSALQIDPNYVPALQSKLEAYVEDMEAYQRARNFVLVRDLAARLAKLDPSNTKAASYQYIATISAWLNNVETPADQVERAMEGLRSLAQADPSDAALPYHIARALIHQGQEAARLHGKPDEAEARYADAARTMDNAVNQQSGNVIMLLRAGQIYSMLEIVADKTKNAGRFGQQAAVYLERARMLVRPADEAYQEVQTVYATHKLQSGDKAEAERTYRELLRQKPNEVAVRLVLAEILQADRSTRQEAADLLADTVQRGERPDAPRTAIARMLQLRAIVRLASVRMDLLEDAPDAATRQNLLAQIETDIAKARSMGPEGAETLKVIGRLHLIKGDVLAAVQTLSKAMQLLDQLSARRDYELMYSLARAQIAAQQNEEAKRLLRQVVATIPTFTPARYLLVDLLISSNETVEAAQHIDELDRQMPNAALVARFRVMTLDPARDKAEIDKNYRRLPEDNRVQLMEKARLAILINRPDEAVRLLEVVRAAFPRDVRVADRLAQVYLYKNDRARGLAVIEDALKVAPRDAQLLLLRARLQNATSEDMIGIAQNIVSETADPLARALQQAELARMRGNAVELKKNLDAAEKISPNDPRVQDGLFNYYLATRQYDVAIRYIEPLAKINYGGSQGLIYWWKFYAAKGDYTNAIRIGRDFTAKMPEFATSWVTLGQALKMNKQFPEALAAFKAARDRQRANRDAIRGAIDCLYAMNRQKEAAEILADALKLYPTDLGLLEMKLEYDLVHGDPTDAVKPILENLARNPEQINHYLNASSLYYRLSLSQPKESRQYMDKAQEVLKQAIAKFPNQPQPYVSLAELQNINRDRAGAEATLQQMGAQESIKNLAEPKLMLAEFFLKGGEPAKAEAPLREAVALAPRSLEIRRKLAVYLSQQRRVNDAIKVLDEAPDGLAMDPMLIQSRLEIKTAAGLFGEVERDARAVMQDRPNDPNLLAILANAQLNQNKFAEAIGTADEAIKLDAMNPRARITRAMAKMRRPGGDLTDAINDLVEYRNANPADTRVRLLLADAYARKQRPDDAVRELEVALQNAPTDVTVRTALLEAYRQSQPPRWTEGDQVVREAKNAEGVAGDPDWLMAEANWWVSRRQPAQAVEKIRQAVAAAPNDTRYLQGFLGVLLATNNHATLLKETDAMLAADPKRWWVHQARGLAHRAGKDDARASSEFAQAFRVAMANNDSDGAEAVVRTTARELGPDAVIDWLKPHVPGNLRLSQMLAHYYVQKGDSSAARGVIDQLVTQVDAASPPMQAAILGYAGSLYSAMKPAQLDKASAAYQKLLQLQPDNPEALNQMAWLLAVETDPPQPEKALEYSTRAHERTTSSGRFNPNILDTHGWVLVLNGKLDAAVEILSRLVEQAPSIESHYHLGEAYLRQGKPELAATQLRAAQRLIDIADQGRAPVDPVLREKVRGAFEAAKSGNQ